MPLWRDFSYWNRKYWNNSIFNNSKGTFLWELIQVEYGNKPFFSFCKFDSDSCEFVFVLFWIWLSHKTFHGTTVEQSSEWRCILRSRDRGFFFWILWPPLAHSASAQLIQSHFGESVSYSARQDTALKMTSLPSFLHFHSTPLSFNFSLKLGIRVKTTFCVTLAAYRSIPSGSIVKAYPDFLR